MFKLNTSLAEFYIVIKRIYFKVQQLLFVLFPNKTEQQLNRTFCQVFYQKKKKKKKKKIINK